MKCKQIEKLIVDTPQGELDSHTKEAIANHVSSCAKCNRFADNTTWMRNKLSSLECESPPDYLLQRTKSLCHLELETKLTLDQKAVLQNPHIPKWIWILFFIVLALMQIFIVPLFIENTMAQDLNIHWFLALMMIIQNMTMLFLSPVLLSRFKVRNRMVKLGHI